MLSSVNKNRRCEFWFPHFGARRGGRITLTHTAAKRLIKTVSKDKLAARNNTGKTILVVTDPMANAYANAAMLEKLENLVATFHHRKSTNTSS